MTAIQQFKILEILEPSLGREKAAQFTQQIEDQFQSKTESLVTKEDLFKHSISTKEEIQKASERLKSRMWATFITLVVMMLWLYATIIFKH